MGPASTASGTLERARRFLALAERADPNTQRQELEDFLAAAIVFGRSVTFHLRAELRRPDGFNEWYAERQKEMEADPLMRSLLKMRNLEVHEGPTGARRVVAVEITTALSAETALSVHVRRGSPWYRRSPRILWEDARRRLSRWLRSARTQLTPAARAKPAATEGSSRVRSELFLELADSNLAARPAFELLHEYLDKLEAIVAAAAVRFRRPTAD